MRFFNTSGPVVAADHYCIPPLDRLNLSAVRRFVREKRYFVLHAPRQTGKTSVLLTLRDLLNAEGDYRCVYVNVEGGQAGREDAEQVVRTILGTLALRASATLNDEFLLEVWSSILAEFGPHAAVQVALTRWAEAHPKPLVLLIDEIDALLGDALLSVLRQLRADWDVYRTGRKLTYRKQPCAPADPGVLSRSRQRYGFDNLGFYFDRRGMRRGDQCIAIAHLPDYPSGRIRVGQWLSNGNRTVWDAEFSGAGD